MMIPEAWENHATMSPEKRAFYRFHASLMEPWDGPASIAFTDGTVIGAVLDRNGLRPSRYWVTDDDRVIMASETGVVDIDPAARGQEGPPAARAACSWSTPRRVASSTTRRSRPSLAAEHPYAEWLEAGLVHLDDLPDREHVVSSHESVRAPPADRSATPTRSSSCSSRRWRKTGYEAIGSMGTDTPIAVLSERPRLLFDYFQQLFAQVTNPPLDAIREELVTSLSSTIGPGGQPARSRARTRAARSSCRSRSSTTTSWPSSSTSTTTATGPHLAAQVISGLYRVRRRRRGAARGARPGAPGSVGGDRGRASASWCCPTATPTPSARRSRRCC